MSTQTYTLEGSFSPRSEDIIDLVNTVNLVVHLEELKWKHPLHSKTPNLYVEAKVGDAIRKTRSVEGRAPAWNESLTL